MAETSLGFVLAQLRTLPDLRCEPVVRDVTVISSAGVRFGLVAGGRLFFRVGTDTITRYLAREMEPFRLESPADRARLPHLRGYWSVPPEVITDERALVAWAKSALDAVRREPARQRSRGRPFAPARKRRGGGPSSSAE